MIFLMAQGKGSRWAHEAIPYKQFVRVSGATVIERTLSVFKEAMPVCSADFARHFKKPYPYTSLREPTQGLLSGIVETVGQFDFDEEITILLGDVVYSRKMAHLILNTSPSTVCMFGRFGANIFTEKDAGEIFAMKMSSEYKIPFMNICRTMLERRRGEKLWDFYNVNHTEFHQIFHDWTDDIDSQAEYEKFGKKLIELAEKEDYV